MKKIGILLVLIAVVSFFLFYQSGLLLGANQEDNTEKDIGYQADEPGVFDSADTAVIVEMNTGEKTITLRNMNIEKEYTLLYDGTTCFYNKHGSSMSIEQMQVGDVVDVTFYKPSKRCNTMQISEQAWNYNAWSKYELDAGKKQVTIGSIKYTCLNDMIITSNGTEKTLDDLNAMDVLTFQGIGTDIYSIIVEKGHGYLRLENDEYFYGGWIEVGTKVIQQISENMVLTVPEGNQQVLVSNNGTSGTKKITVERDQEVSLDIGDLKGEDPSYGNVVFSITPSDASLYIDGEKTDYSIPVKLEYGIHQMIVRADGYDTITQYLKVAQASAGIEVNMSESSDDSVSDNDTSDNAVEEDVASDSVTTSTQDYYVTITAPSDVEVYEDGNYIGISPCDFKKEAGSHTITLRKTGYVSKTYTVQIDSEEENITYSFPDLAVSSED